MPPRTSSSDAINTYLRKIQENLASGISSEDTHRSAIEHLLESLDPTIRAFNDPKHISVGLEGDHPAIQSILLAESRLAYVGGGSQSDSYPGAAAPTCSLATACGSGCCHCPACYPPAGRR